MNNLRQISLILYRLKKNFGVPVRIYHPIQNSYDLTTGDIQRDYAIHLVRKAIILTADIRRDFVYALSYIAANKNFTYGALFENNTRPIIIDYADLPDFTITTDDHVEYDGRRYQIKQVQEAAKHRGVILIVENINAAETVGVPISVETDIEFTSDSMAEKP